MARTLAFVSRPTPAKASLDAQHRTHRIANNLQVLSGLDPSALDYVDHLVADLRARAELAIHVSRERRSAQWQ